MAPGVKVHLRRKSYGFRATVWNGEKHLERRVHTRYLSTRPWTSCGRTKEFFTGDQASRAKSIQKAFLFTQIRNLWQRGVEVEDCFPSPGDAEANLGMRTQSLIIRVVPPAGPEEQHGFAILNRSCKLHAGIIPLKRGT